MKEDLRARVMFAYRTTVADGAVVTEPWSHCRGWSLNLSTGGGPVRVDVTYGGADAKALPRGDDDPCRVCAADLARVGESVGLVAAHEGWTERGYLVEVMIDGRMVTISFSRPLRLRTRANVRKSVPAGTDSAVESGDSREE